MKINYTLSAIMKLGHSIAKTLKLDTYKKAISIGLKKAWKIAKGIVDVEEVKEVVHSEEVIIPCEFIPNVELSVQLSH